MKSGSKRGAALAYVIMVTVVLMVLASALVFTAKFNIDYAQNSLESRQAYLTAKSAIEYGKAYLMKNPDNGDFKVYTAASGAGFTTDEKNAISLIASYDSGARTINAKAKYKSSTNRFRLLGFTMGEAEGGGGGASASNTDFVIVGALKFNGVPVMSRWSNGGTFYQGNSASQYAVCFQYPVGLEAKTHNASLTAPQIYFFGKDWSNASIYGYTGDIRLNTDFIYMSGNITGQNYGEADRLSIKLTTVGGILYIAGQNGCSIIIQSNNVSSTFVIPKGYYQIKSECDLVTLTKANLSNYLVKISSSEAGSKVDLSKVDFMEKNYANILSGDDWDNSQGTRWTLNNGKLSDGYPSEYVDRSGTHQVNWSGNGDLTKYYVNLYVTDCKNWQNAFQGGNSAVYKAKEIFLQYVSAEDFLIPENQVVTFQANLLSFNTQITDEGIESKRPAISQGNAKTSFLLTSLDGGNVQVKIVNPLEVNKADGSNFTILAGTYSVVNRSNFFNKGIWPASAIAVAGSPSGGTGGTGGGVDVSGGVYTNGQ